MVHRIFTGPFIALEERLIQEIAGLQSEDPLAPVAILVGSNVLATYLKYRIAERGRAAANLRFYTFIDLAARLGSAAPRQTGMPRLPGLGASMILDEILRSESPKVFERVSAFDGFRRAILDTFRDLRDAGVSPEELSRSVRDIVRSRPDRREHLEAVARLYDAFRQKVASFRDVDDDFRAAIENSARAAGILGSSHLLVYGIYDVTGQQGDLLRGLKDALNLIYLVPYVNSSASGFAAAFIDGLIRELEVQVTCVPAPPSRRPFEIFPESEKSDAPSSHQDPRRPEPRGDFSLILVPGESRVAIEIAREILRAVRDGMIAGFHEAAVFLRHPEDEAPILAEALRLRKIPFFILGGIPFAQRPLGKAVMAIARLEADSFSRPSILRAMELIAAALPRDLAEEWDAPRWRRLTNDPAFLSGVESWDRGTEDLISRKMRELRDAEHREELPAGFLDEEVEGRARSAGRARQERDAASLLRNCWIALRQAAAEWPKQLTWRNWAQLLEERLAPVLGASQDWQSFSAVLDNLSVLSDAAEVANLGLEVGREELASQLEESLAEFTFREGRFQRNGVNILSITASRGLHFPLVIVPGLDEGKFPARLRQDPFLLDEERRQVGNPSRLPQKSLRTEEEKLLFDMAARAAERRLVLVASRLDENSDRERIPSDFFLRAAAAAKGRIVRYDELREDIIPGLRTVRLDSPAPPPEEVAVDAAEIRLRLIATPRQGAKVLETLALADPDRLARPRQFNLSRWKRILTGYDGAIRVAELVRWVAVRHGPSAGPVSASRLEDYGKCPYLFFLKRVIGLEEWEEVEMAETIHPLERGKLVHKILESFLKAHGGEKFTATPPAELASSLSLLVRYHLDESKPPGIPDLLWEIESDRLLEMLQSWLEYETKRLDGGFLPSHFEHAFGEFSPQEKAAPFRVQAGEYVFDFRGKIDRVDLSRDRKQARVLDYKVGSLPATMARESATPLMGGEKLQLAVYSGALSALPEFSNVEQVQGEYLYLQPKDGRTVSCSFDPEILRAARMRLGGVLEIMGRGIEKGAFFARTHGSVRTEDHCRFCQYLTICGKDRVQREERKAEDPAVKEFAEMQKLDEKAL